MASILTIESLDFDRIRRGDGRATGDAVEFLWLALNDEARQRRQGVRLAVDRSERMLLAQSPSAALDDYVIDNASVLRFDGAASVNLTGIIAPSGGVARTLLLFVLGAGTITLKHDSGSSEALNRIFTYSAGDVAIATNQCVALTYLDSRWRELKWA